MSIINLAEATQRNTRPITCDVHGEQIETGFMSRWFGCPICADIEAEKRKAETLKKEQAEFVKQVGIPALFKNTGFLDYQAFDNQQKKVLERVKQYAIELKNGSNQNLVLAGTTGAGKTHLACAVLRNLAGKGVRCTYVSSADLVGQIRASWDFKTRTRFESEIVSGFGGIPVLMIDDLGVNDTIKADIWSDIFDKRYSQNLPTIITTNLGESALAEVIGDRAASRVLPRSIWANCVWGDHRRAVAKMEVI